MTGCFYFSTLSVFKLTFSIPIKFSIPFLPKSRLEGHPLQARRLTGLSGSDVGSNGVKLASSFVNQNRQILSDLVFGYVVPYVLGTLIGRGLRFEQWRRTRNLVKERNPICAWMNEITKHQFAGD